jgi:hypothetical protein
MKSSHLGLAAFVSPVRSEHGVLSPRQEGVAESHGGVATPVLLSLKAESKVVYMDTIKDTKSTTTRNHRQFREKQNARKKVEGTP